MYSLTVENTKGEQMNLTQNPDYTIINIDGLHPPDAIINTMERAGHDGSLFNSAKVDNRQIILDIAINKNACVNRNNLYRFFQSARPVRLIYNNELRGVYIDGYVQNAPIAFFEQKQTIQITIICPDPFWHSTVNVEGMTDGMEALFEFPFSIPEGGIPFSEYYGGNAAHIWNPGTVESGIIMEIRATGAATNPRIYHQNTDTFFRVNTTLQSGDVLTIDTRPDHKKIHRVRSGATTNLIASRDLNSTWLIMDPGENVYILSAASGVGNLTCQISSVTNIEGV
jgi:predicted phage tail component-like protein